MSPRGVPKSKTCECGRPLPRLALLAGDPFCSNTCAKRHYGTEESMPETRLTRVRQYDARTPEGRERHRARYRDRVK